MPELDEDLRVLRGHARELCAGLRPYALELDRDPAAVNGYLHLPAIARMATLQLPPEFNPDPLVVGRRRFPLVSAVERAVFMEEAAAADLGMMLASPGAPMAGLAVAMLGDRAQQEWFYGRLLDRPTWTVFALTEPTGGSDANGMRSTLSRDGDRFVLRGAKRYVGNATRAEIGVVFARTGPGPLGPVAVLVDRSAPGFTAAPVPTIGLRGAALGALTFDAVEVAPDRVLGRHLPTTRRGMWGWLRTFNLLRPTVAAMGLGIARAAHEYVVDHRDRLRPAERDGTDALAGQITAVRRLTLAAAAAADRDPADGELASVAKLRAARLAREATLTALRSFGPGARLEHPYLEKLARDAQGVEFMEGTSNIQRMSLFHPLTRRGRPEVRASGRG